MKWMKKQTNPNKSSLTKIADFSGHVGAIFDVIYCNGALLTSAADHFIAQWDIETGKQTDFSIKLERSAYNFAYSDVKNWLAMGTTNGDIHIVDLKERKEIKVVRHHKFPIFAMTYNPTTHHFYSGDKEGNFCVWDEKTFDLQLTYPYDCGKIREIKCNEEGSLLAICGQDGYIRILDTTFFNLQAEFKANDEGVNCAAFDGDFIYTGGKDAYINLWNWKKERRILSIPAHNFPIYDIELIDSKKRLVSASFDKSIKLWNAQDLSVLERMEYKNGGHRSTVNRIVKINEQSFATVSDDRKIMVWELKD